MDDTFTFVAPVLPRRQVDPFALKLAIAATAFVALVGSFGSFVVGRERAADGERAALEASVVAEEQARVEMLLSEAPGSDATVAANAADEPARQAARRAAELAVAATTAGSYALAGPAQLTTGEPTLLFVDGPSTTPTVVSVVAERDAWGAAVMGSSGTCYWIAVAGGGATTYGTGSTCTGVAALAAAATSW